MKIQKMKIQKIILSLAILSIVALPALTMAQVGGSPPAISYDITELGNVIVSKVWIVFTVLAIIMFVFAGILFLTANGAPEKVASARSAFLWGVVGIVVGILAYTIISVVTSLVQ